MRILLFLASAMLLFSSTACGDKKAKGKLKITIKGKFDTETLVLYANKYPLSGTDSITMQAINFFLSDIKLLKNNGNAVDIEDVAFVDLETNHTSATTAVNGESFTIENIPVGNYAKLQMGVGVSPALNATEPGNYTTDSPLGIIGNYWTAWNSYIFSRIEGRLFPSGASPIAFLYHTGVDGTYQSKEYTKDIEIIEDETTEIIFDLNAKEIIIPQSGTTIPIATNNMSHSGAVGTASYNLAKDVITNLANSLHLQ